MQTTTVETLQTTFIATTQKVSTIGRANSSLNAGSTLSEIPLTSTRSSKSSYSTTYLEVFTSLSSVTAYDMNGKYFLT